MCKCSHTRSCICPFLVSSWGHLRFFLESSEPLRNYCSQLYFHFRCSNTMVLVYNCMYIYIHIYICIYMYIYILYYTQELSSACPVFFLSIPNFCRLRVIGVVPIAQPAVIATCPGMVSFRRHPYVPLPHDVGAIASAL
jgi:hypothetical protein